MKFYELFQIYKAYDFKGSDYDFGYEEEILKLFNSVDDSIINRYKNSTNCTMLYWIGNYYASINNEKAVKYWILASENKNINAMRSLASYYELKNETISVIKYYTMAFENGWTYAITMLGDYFKNINNYQEMVKYYMIAFENGELDGLIELADYHKDISKNYKLMVHYLMIVINYTDNTNNYNIKHNKSEALCRLGNYYKDIEKNYDLMKEYYLLAIEKYENPYAMASLGDYYENIEQNYDLMLKYYLMGIYFECQIAMENLKKYYVKEKRILDLYQLLLSEFEKCRENFFLLDEVNSLYNKLNCVIIDI